MKKMTATAFCAVLPALAAFALPAAANGVKLTSSALTIAVTDTRLDDGVVAGYTAGNLAQSAALTAYTRLPGGYITESFYANSPEVLPQDALVAFNGVSASTTVTGQLGAVEIEKYAPADILTRPTGSFLYQTFNASQTFVLQPHTTLTFSGRYAVQMSYDGPSYVPVEGGDIWLDLRTTFDIWTSQSSVRWGELNYSQTRDYTFQLVNNSDVVSEQYVKFQSWSDIDTAFVAEVPEPATWGMMAAGLSLLALRTRRQRKPGA